MKLRIRAIKIKSSNKLYFSPNIGNKEAENWTVTNENYKNNLGEQITYYNYGRSYQVKCAAGGHWCTS